MKRIGKRSVVEAIERERISAIIRTNDQALAKGAMEAAVEGGFRMVEFTLTTPGALVLITEFSKRSDLIVGAGTVLSPSQARDAVSAGARFLVSPIVDREVIEEAAKLDVPSIPGAYTPTEMQTAYRCGADFVKVFPMPANGVGFIEAVRGPLPHLRLFPTAGVTPDNFLEYLGAGCAGMGFVRSLFEPADLAGPDFVAIRERAAGITTRLAEWRSSQ
ncbi:MAG: bifunctional 4-hydroxy-2-oxoglutarate aldolase/2-dehydro-3-deoxy-phosphogluconate aldolase [Phycisphaerales bacterium]|nr:MAG: bifunctional 4-hydroxy-2-oxoglutarate aldolase/2-dehydro-3-deoxy-phosphogluconate aldolase [Phycisphaerales bacterium]